jgi:hypothetical protein
MEATFSSETSVSFQRTTRRYISDPIHNHFCENLKSYSTNDAENSVFGTYSTESSDSANIVVHGWYTWIVIT